MIKRLASLSTAYGLIPIASWLIRGHLRLMHYEIEGEERIRRHLQSGGKAIVAIWHQRILMAIHYARRFSAYAPAVMISRSRDGEMIARVYARLNFRPVRGSSSTGGQGALHALVADLASHPLAVHVVDGPRGPRGVVKGGLITLAQLSGVPIVPLAFSCSRAWVLNSWDSFLIPKPCSRIRVHWGELIPVSAELDRDAFEALRWDVQARMRTLQNDDDRRWGWAPFF